MNGNVYNEVIEKRYWNIGQLADKFSVTKSQIRFWCNYFKIITERTAANKMKFSSEDVDKLSRIISYVREGYHLKAIKNKL